MPARTKKMLYSLNVIEENPVSEGLTCVVAGG